MDYPVKKVVMTGGSGPVGAALLRKLLQENVKILLFLRENSTRKAYIPQDERIQIVSCDLENLCTYEPQEFDYDVFFHLGWVQTNKVKRHDMQVQLQNVKYACDAAVIAKKMGCHTFIGAGSQAEYGRHDEPLAVDTVCRPEIAYGVAKLSANYSTKLMCEQQGMRHIWTRILSAYGVYDYDDLLISSTIIKALKKERLDFTKAEQVWDFVYEDDLADSLFAIAQRGKHGISYPIGSGQARPLREYIEILRDQIDPKLQLHFGAFPYPENQVMHLSADISRVVEDTGWHPKVSYEDGIARTIQHIKQTLR